MEINSGLFPKRNGVYWLFLLLAALIFLLPAFNIPPLFSPPAWGKTSLFRVFMAVLLGLVFFQLLWDRGSIPLKKYLKRDAPVFLPLVTLLGVLFVSALTTLVSLDQYFSFWGTPPRAWGFLNFALYILFALLLFAGIHRRDWAKLWGAAFLGGAAVALVGIAQQFSLLPPGLLIEYQLHIPSTLGNPIFLSLYLLMLFFMALAFFIKARSALLRGTLGVLAALFLFVLLLALSRAAYAGVATGFLVFLLLYPGRSAGMRVAVTLLLILATAGVAYVNLAPPPRFIQQNPRLETVWDRLSVERALENVRFDAWKLGVRAVAARPVLGYGLYNSSVAFDRYFDDANPKFIEGGTWWDTFHNLYVDTAVGSGLLGLGALLAFLGALLYKLRGAARAFPLPVLGVQSALVGYLVAMVFSLNTFSVYLIFFLLVAYAFVLIDDAQTA